MLRRERAFVIRREPERFILFVCWLVGCFVFVGLGDIAARCCVSTFFLLVLASTCVLVFWGEENR